jgi:uncharacterized membrane protein
MKKLRLSVNTRSLIIIPVIVYLLILLLPSAVMAQDGKDTFYLTYAAGGYNNEIAAGESKTLYLEVTNDSDIPTTNIQFSYNAPEDWLVEFEFQSIDVLDANSFQTVEVNVTAPVNVEKGDYSITFIADSSVGRRVLDTFFWVEKGTNIWVWVGGALGIVVIILFVLIYRRFGKS